MDYVEEESVFEETPSTTEVQVADLKAKNQSLSLDRRSLDERIKMLDEMMDKQQQKNKVTTTTTTVTCISASTTLASEPSAMSAMTNVLSPLPTTPKASLASSLNKPTVKLSKIFDLDEQRLYSTKSLLALSAGGNSGGDLACFTANKSVASVASAVLALSPVVAPKDKFANSPMFSGSGASILASAYKQPPSLTFSSDSPAVGNVSGHSQVVKSLSSSPLASAPRPTEVLPEVKKEKESSNR